MYFYHYVTLATLGYRPGLSQKQLYHSAHFHKSYKHYFISVVHGKGSVINNPNSEVTLEVTGSVKTMVMQHSHTNFESVRRAIPQKECLITPVVQLHTTELTQDQEDQDSTGYKYKVTIPHYLFKRCNLSCIKVRHGDINKPNSLITLKNGITDKEELPFYKVEGNTITIFCNYFCDVMCTSTNKICTSRILALPFGRICTESSNAQTHTKLKIYVCSFLYTDQNLKLVSLQFYAVG